MEPESVVFHKSKEALLGSTLPIAETTHSTTALTASIECESERGLVHQPGWIVVVLDLDAVIGVVADSIFVAQSIGAQSVLVGDDRNRAVRSPQDLAPDARPVIEFPV